MRNHQNRNSIVLFMMAAFWSAATLTSAAPIDAIADQPDAWFTSAEGKATLDVVLSYQNTNGGWNKAYKLETPRPAPDGGMNEKARVKWNLSTFDNGATHTELRILARAFRVTGESRYADAVRRGLQFIADAQYANGGWPQRFPLEKDYGRHITFNDDATLGILRVLRSVVEASPDFAWLSDEDRAQAAAMMKKGIECILATQIRVDGKPTVWCQQHDEITLAPASARSYELPSFCSTESAGLVLFLMELPEPDERVKNAIEGAARWFETHKILGKRVEKLTGDQYELGKQTNLIDDPSAKPIWARFYDLDTGKPYFCDRDGVKLERFEQLGHERRVNYAWFNDRGNKVLERYATWREQR